MSEDKKAFKINDRRHFTPEGEARGPGEEVRIPDAPPAEVAPPAGAPPTPVSPVDAEAPPADLIGLFVSLATQASILLSDAPAEEAGTPGPDLGGARAVIALLEVLKAKTAGNRTPDEDRVLEGVLYELRMAYLARSRKGA
jgi:hypothetical protein